MEEMIRTIDRKRFPSNVVKEYYDAIKYKQTC